MRPAFAFLMLSTLLAPCCTRAQVPLQLPNAATTSPREVEALFAEASRLIYSPNEAAALRVIRSFMASERFASQDPGIRHPILGLEALVLLLTDEAEEAHAAFVELTKSDYATASDWIGRAESAAKLMNLDEYAADLSITSGDGPTFSPASRNVISVGSSTWSGRVTRTRRHIARCSKRLRRMPPIRPTPQT